MLEVLKIYLLIPFIFAFILGVSTFLKNPIHIRRIAKIFFFFQFIFTFCIFVGFDKSGFSLFNINFIFEENSSLFIFLTSFIFFIFSVISKTFIKKSNRLFYSTLSLLLGLINLIILSDNIFLILASVFWILLVNYLYNSNFSKSNKQTFTNQLKIDIIILLTSFVLIFYNFARLFILNDIPFDFTQLKDNLYHINSISILAGFLGFIIIAFKFCSLIPFSGKTLQNSTKINGFLCTINYIVSIFTGNILLLKILPAFDYLIYDFEDYFGIYLIFNLAWFILLSFKEKYLLNFAITTLLITSTSIIFSLFSFVVEGMTIFVYGISAIITSYMFLFIVFNLISEKLKTDKIDELTKIPSKNKIFKLFIITALLNIMKIPGFALFSSTLISLVNIFSIDYDGIILNFIPYFLLLGAFIVTILSYNIFNKILIEPQTQSLNKTELSNHQIITLTALAAVVIILGIFPQNFFNGGF